MNIAGELFFRHPHVDPLRSWRGPSPGDSARALIAEVLGETAPRQPIEELAQEPVPDAPVSVDVHTREYPMNARRMQLIQLGKRCMVDLRGAVSEVLRFDATSWFAQRRRRPLHPAPAILAALALAACSHTPRPALVQAFPPAPIADLKAELPKQAPLPPKATLREILEAGILDEQAIALLRDEVRVWRKWWLAQASALAGK